MKKRNQQIILQIEKYYFIIKHHSNSYGFDSCFGLFLYQKTLKETTQRFLDFAYLKELKKNLFFRKIHVIQIYQNM